eukprot:COSAG04_NODE_11068_length_733_cov_0.949527_2_plen_65_part_01
MLYGGSGGGADPPCVAEHVVQPLHPNAVAQRAVHAVAAGVATGGRVVARDAAVCRPDHARESGNA